MKTSTQFIDLTHPLTSTTPSWNRKDSFECATVLDYHECTSAVTFRVQELRMPAGIGTHIDAPSHCFKGGRSVAELSLQELIVPCYVIDVSDHADENYVVCVDDVIEFEQKYGQIQPSTFVIIRTGWDAKWNNRAEYHNDHKFPSISAQTAQFLVDRNIAGIGIDTLSPDVPTSGFPVHGIILGADKYIVENVANSEQLPPVGSTVFIMPLSIKEGSESPVRMIACLP